MSSAAYTDILHLQYQLHPIFMDRHELRSHGWRKVECRITSGIVSDSPSGKSRRVVSYVTILTAQEMNKKTRKLGCSL